jgi:hypothetical protein
VALKERTARSYGARLGKVGAIAAVVLCCWDADGLLSWSLCTEIDSLQHDGAQLLSSEQEEDKEGRERIGTQYRRAGAEFNSSACRRWESEFWRTLAAPASERLGCAREAFENGQELQLSPSHTRATAAKLLRAMLASSVSICLPPHWALPALHAQRRGQVHCGTRKHVSL